MDSQHLERELRVLHQVANALWSAYLHLGPGKLKPIELIPVDKQIESCKRLLARHPQQAQDQTLDSVAREELTIAIHTTQRLLHHAVERNEGLCFITGEAGLIPRQDLHARLEDALSRIASVAGEF